MLGRVQPEWFKFNIMINSHYESILSNRIILDLQGYAYKADYQPIEQEYMGEIYQSVSVHSLPTAHPLSEHIVKSFLSFNKHYFKYDLCGSFEIQFLKYVPGGHYNWHCDYGITWADSSTQKAQLYLEKVMERYKSKVPLMDEISDGKKDRKLSMSIQLSCAWDYTGGDLLIRDWHNRKQYISKEIGNVVVFDSRVPHKVEPIVDGERYAIVAWAHGPELR